MNKEKAIKLGIFLIILGSGILSLVKEIVWFYATVFFIALLGALELYLRIQHNIDSNFNDTNSNFKRINYNLRKLEKQGDNYKIAKGVNFLKGVGWMIAKEQRQESLMKLAPDVFNHKTVLYIGASERRSDYLSEFKNKGYEISVLEAFKSNVDYLKKIPWIKEVIHGDVRKFKSEKKYDVVFWWHGPEHIEERDLVSVLERLEALCKKIIVLGCPFGKYEQEEIGGNPYEKHLSHLDGILFEELGYGVGYIGRKDQEGSNITAVKYIGETEIDKKKLKEINERIKKQEEYSKKDLAIVCCHFNPCKYKKRLMNYKLFRKEMDFVGAHLLTVELAFGEDDFELSDFPNVMQLRAKDVMWQKERLLNIGIKKLLKEGYRKVAWVDADILFEDKDWLKKLSEKLEEYPVCQLFSKIYRDRDRDRTGDYELGAVSSYKKESVFPTLCPGGGWGARAEVLKEISLYDSAIVGGGDFLLFCACYNEALEDEETKERLINKYGNLFFKHYFNWAKKWNSIIKGKVGYVDVLAKVLYHGDHKDRKYDSRNDPLIKYKFNPEEDLKLDKNECWEWATDKKKLHKTIRNYFYIRKEDD
jgi:hypothetical protein